MLFRSASESEIRLRALAFMFCGEGKAEEAWECIKNVNMWNIRDLATRKLGTCGQQFRKSLNTYLFLVAAASAHRLRSLIQESIKSLDSPTIISAPVRIINQLMSNSVANDMLDGTTRPFVTRAFGALVILMDPHNERRATELLTSESIQHSLNQAQLSTPTRPDIVTHSLVDALGSVFALLQGNAGTSEESTLIEGMLTRMRSLSARMLPTTAPNAQKVSLSQ